MIGHEKPASVTRDNSVLIKLHLDLKTGPAWRWSIIGTNGEGLHGVTAEGTVPYYGDLTPEGGRPTLPGVLEIVLDAARRLEGIRANASG